MIWGLGGPFCPPSENGGKRPDAHGQRTTASFNSTVDSLGKTLIFHNCQLGKHWELPPALYADGVWEERGWRNPEDAANMGLLPIMGCLSLHFPSNWEGERAADAGQDLNIFLCRLTRNRLLRGKPVELELCELMRIWETVLHCILKEGSVFIGSISYNEAK